MNLPLFISRRYLISRKSHNIINIIAAVSVTGVTIGTMALIIILSVFNGFEELVLSLFNAFNPDLKIEVTEGKTFRMSEFPADELERLPGVAYLTEIVEENALVKYEEKQHIVKLKGVDGDYQEYSPVSDHMISGALALGDESQPMAVIGAGVAYRLSIYIGRYTPNINVYVPKRSRKNFSGTIDQAFNNRLIAVNGVFGLQQEFDSKYVIVPIGFARDLLEYEDEVTSLEVKLGPDADLNAIQSSIQSILGDDYRVRNQYEQQRLLYQVFSSEKWATFLILAFILIIATFNVIGILSILILEKKKDIAVLWSLGAEEQLIKRIFTYEGLMISLLGGIIGLVLGVALAFLQQQYGLISLGGGGGSYIVEAYPVRVEWLDVLYVFLTVMAIGFITVWFPVRQISKKYMRQRLNFFLMR